MLGNGVFNGMYNSATVWASDSSMYFDGVNDVASLVGTEGSFDELFSSDGMTVSMWVRLSTTDDCSFFQMWSRTTGRILFFWDASAQKVYLSRSDNNNQNTQTQSANLATNTIGSTNHCHLVFRISNGSISIVVNSVLGESLVDTVPIWSVGGAYEIYFGASKNTSNVFNKFSRGWIHDITIWNTHLPTSAINEIYNQGLPNNVLELKDNNLEYYQTCSEKNFESETEPIPTVNNISSNNPVLSGAIISRHDQIS